MTFQVEFFHLGIRDSLAFLVNPFQQGGFDGQTGSCFCATDVSQHNVECA